MTRWQWGIGGLNKKALILLVVGFVVRLALMPITLHGDIFHIWGVVTLALKGTWDPFVYAVANYENIAESTFDVYYPPAAYVIYSLFLMILNIFSTSLVGWLEYPRELVLREQDVSLGIFIQNLDKMKLLFNIFLLKIPNFIYEIIILSGLFKLIMSRQRLESFSLWIINPIVIYSAYMMGQIDLLTAGLVVWATVMMTRGRKIASLTLLVIGTMVKVLPIVLIAPAAFLLGKSWKERTFLVLYSAAIFIGFNLPFAHDLNRLRIAYFPPIMPSIIDLSLRPDAIVMTGKFLAAAAVGLWLGYMIIRNERKIKPKQTAEIIGLLLLLFFVAYRGALFNHYVVLMPFLILFWMKEKRAVLKMLAFSGLLLLTHIYTRPLQGELFIPLGVDWLTNFPSTRELVAPWFKYEHLSLATGTIISGWLLAEVISRGKKIINPREFI